MPESVYISSKYPPSAKSKIIPTIFSFPLVVKPTDSSGSKGVTMLNNWSGLEDAVRRADSFSRNKILLIEEYIQRGFPSIIGGDIFVWNGAIVLYGEMECLRDTLRSPLIPIGKKMPVSLTELQRGRIHNELQRIVTALGVRFGEMNIEILLDKGGQGPFSGIRSSCGRQYDPDTIKRYLGHRLSESQCASRHGRNT